MDIQKNVAWTFLAVQCQSLPTNAEDTGSVPSPGRFHVPRGDSACAQLPNLCSRAPAPQQEKTPQGEAHTP